MDIDDAEYRWKSKGMGSKVVVRRRSSCSPTLTKLNSISRASQLVDKATNATVAQSHSRIRSSIFKKPRDMSLEISQTASHAVDVVLLTFILVWMERKNERAKNSVSLGQDFIDPPPPPPLDD